MYERLESTYTVLLNAKLVTSFHPKSLPIMRQGRLHHQDDNVIISAKALSNAYSVSCIVMILLSTFVSKPSGQEFYRKWGKTEKTYTKTTLGPKMSAFNLCTVGQSPKILFIGSTLF